MSFSLLDIVGTDKALALIAQRGRPFHFGRVAPMRWVCRECGGPCSCVKVPKGASVWCEACDLYDHATTEVK